VDFISRIGGDEFIVVIEDQVSASDVDVLSNRILDALAQAYIVDDMSIKLTASIGVVNSSGCDRSYDDLMRDVDLALYESKVDKNKMTVYTNELGNKFHQRLMLERSIRDAFSQNQFYCLYQPQVDMRTNAVVGVEALLRWFGKDNVSPAVFVPMIEEMGLSDQLNQYVLSQVMMDMSELKYVSTPLKVALNISLQLDSFKSGLSSLLNAYDASLLPESFRLEFEVTEGSVIRTDDLQYSELKGLSDMLRQHGITLAIDDFGVKFSSINRLIDYKFDTIKLDKIFVDRLIGDSSKTANVIVKSVSFLADELGLQMIAEGVENAEQGKILQDCGCFVVQGNLFHKPLTMQELAKLLK
jgi:EAL domain-containing protein (putative c-di-GMP-specific phosphodiesterase class I)